MKKNYVLSLVMVVGLSFIAASGSTMQDNNSKGIRNLEFSEQTTPILTVPDLKVDGNSLDFGVTANGLSSATQSILIHNMGGGTTMSWTINTTAPWLDCAPKSGTNFGVVNISLCSLSSLAIGTNTATISVIAPGAANSPQTVTVTATLYTVNSPDSPIGTFDTPIEASAICGAAPFTGWALDLIGVESVKIYRIDGSSRIYTGDGLFVDGARADVEAAYPGYPNNHKAGWGYLMLTNVFPDGPYVFEAYATDVEGNVVNLGTKNVTISNSTCDKPFGTIDVPCPGCSISGIYNVMGWILAKPFNQIDPTSLKMYIDGIPCAGTPAYGNYRLDILSIFPPGIYLDANNPGFSMSLNSTDFSNGIHTIAVVAADNAGNTNGIGSRYFNIRNLGTCFSKPGISNQPQYLHPTAEIMEIPVKYKEPIGYQNGFREDSETQLVEADKSGHIIVQSKELERIEVRLNPYGDSNRNRYFGYHIIGRHLMPLPIGSTLDTEKGIFYWLPGPGFIGTYRFVFGQEKQNGELSKKLVTVKILPRFTEKNH